MSKSRKSDRPRYSQVQAIEPEAAGFSINKPPVVYVYRQEEKKENEQSQKTLVMTPFAEENTRNRESLVRNESTKEEDCKVNSNPHSLSSGSAEKICLRASEYFSDYSKPAESQPQKQETQAQSMEQTFYINATPTHEEETPGVEQPLLEPKILSKE